MLLSRNEFRSSVFERDNNECVVCGAPGSDAHHILDRKLFDNGGYFLDNGVTLCTEHHLQAERTELSCEELRQLARIKTVVMPEHFYSKQSYDKWGNMYLANGQRVRGEMFDTPGVQTMLAKQLNGFADYIKYPRTYHLPWSEEVKSDDKTLHDLSHFIGKEVVITEKMDGENTTWYNNNTHARSIDSQSTISRTHNKNEWAQKGWQIPINW